jgi:MFS family permease
MRRLILATLVLSLSMGMVNLAIPLYARELGASYTEIGMLGVTYILLYVFLCIPVGRFGDRLGKAPFAIAGFAGTVVVFLLYHTAFSVSSLLVLRLFQGGMEALIWTSLQGMVADLSPVSGRGAAMGKYGMAWGLGFGVGPLLAGALYGCIGARGIFAAGGAIAAVATLSIIGLRGTGGISRPAVNLRRLICPIVAGILYTGMISVVVILLPPYAGALRMTEAQVGILITVFTLTRALLFVPFGRLSDRIGAQSAVTWGSAASSIAFLGFSFATDFCSMALLMFALAVGIGLIYPSIMSLVSSAGGRNTGHVMGLFNSASGLGWALFPGAGGALADAVSPVAPFLMCALAGIAFVGILLMLGKCAGGGN